MGSKGRIPPTHQRRPHPGPAVAHHDPYGLGIRPAPGPFPRLDILPPEVMEQKLAVQHAEMQRLATENQRLAATHGSLRQELATAQHELQILNARIGAMKSEREQQMRGLTDKISKMEAELQAAEPVKVELQKAHSEAQSLVLAREDLMSKIHQLGQDLQRAHADTQQIPALVSELESLRQEYQHCRATYDYEKKFYNDHLESLQAMEKNYMTMSAEVEKLRAELMNSANVDRRTVGAYGSGIGNNENDASGHPTGQSAYDDNYGIRQGHSPHLPAALANTGTGTAAYIGAQSGTGSGRAGYEAPRGPGYEALKGHGYDASRGAGYDSQKGAYEIQRGPAYDVHRGPSSYDPSRSAAYEATSRGAAMSHGQVVPPGNAPYGNAAPPTRAGSNYEGPPRGGNSARR